MDKAASTFGPLEPERRIEAIDMLRGFALFGVLAVNMANFGVPVVLSPALLDQTAYAVMHFFFETKSWRLFSFLFGLGFSLQLLRAESRGGTFLPVYFRRLAILFIIGMGHTLFYRGDILMTYAMLGLILVVFRKVPPKALLLLSALLLAVFPVERALSSLRHDVTVLPSVQVNLEEARANLEELRRTHPYSVGSVADVMAHNAESLSLPNLPNPFTNFRGIESSPQFFAMFLLGLYTGRRRILHDVEKHTVLIRRVLWWGLAVGVLSMTGEQILITTVGYHAFREGAASLIPQFIGDVFLAFGSTALSFGYDRGPRAERPLETDHRTAWGSRTTRLDGVPDADPDVHDPVLWLRFWSVQPNRPRSGVSLRRRFFRAPDRGLCLVGATIPLRACGMALAKSHLSAAPAASLTRACPADFRQLQYTSAAISAPSARSPYNWPSVTCPCPPAPRSATTTSPPSSVRAAWARSGRPPTRGWAAMSMSSSSEARGLVTF